jgi:hypothetical protein
MHIYVISTSLTEFWHFNLWESGMNVMKNIVEQKEDVDCVWTKKNHLTLWERERKKYVYDEKCG